MAALPCVLRHDATNVHVWGINVLFAKQMFQTIQQNYQIKETQTH